MKNTICIIMFGLFTLACVNSQAGDITVDDAWIQEAPPTAKAMAGYLGINNHSKAAIMLESATSEDFGSIEIHSSEMHDGMVHMHKEPHLAIGPAASHTLKPGGYHLMLMKRKRNLQAGDRVGIMLHFSNGEALHIEAEVRK